MSQKLIVGSEEIVWMMGRFQAWATGAGDTFLLREGASLGKMMFGMLSWVSGKI